MTDDRLEQIRKRASAIAPGPWHAYDTEDSWSLHSGMMQILKAHKSCAQHAEYWPYIEYADFIVHSREDVDYLLAEVDRLKAALRAPIWRRRDDR